MAHNLEYPDADGFPDWDSLYRARGDEVVRHRPVFTGDIFEKVRVYGLGQAKTKTVMVLQHPCALRSNGLDLRPRLQVAELRSHPLIRPEGWTGHAAKMPLPALFRSVESGRRHQAAFFDEPYLVGPEDLVLDKRIACLSQAGVNLLWQRLVHYNSRTVVPTATFQEVSSAAYEEADLIEEWCEERIEAGLEIDAATSEVLKWLREDTDGFTRQRMLEDPQSRSTVRQQMRSALRELR